MDFVRSSLEEASNCLKNFINKRDQIENIYKGISLLCCAIERGGRVFSCGNGGSMCDAMHFAEELTGRYRKNRQAFSGIAISDASHMSCVSNDFGYDSVFSRYIEANGRPGDVVVGLSTSGASENVIKLFEVCKKKNIHSILLTGSKNSKAESLADLTIIAEGVGYADRVQEIHIKILHIFIEGIERKLSPSNY